MNNMTMSSKLYELTRQQLGRDSKAYEDVTSECTKHHPYLHPMVHALTARLRTATHLHEQLSAAKACGWRACDKREHLYRPDVIYGNYHMLGHTSHFVHCMVTHQPV